MEKTEKERTKERNQMIGGISGDVVIDAALGVDVALPIIKRYFPKIDDIRIRQEMGELKGARISNDGVKRTLVMDADASLAKRTDAFINIVKLCARAMDGSKASTLIRLGLELQSVRGN
ncbi:MAG TPA: hypothetical protein VMV00_00450 [Candidatus Baltobacteraceae bacterium]|nr:hypothetical protein [Candidatus Baltobacteraceae bacterium]